MAPNVSAAGPHRTPPPGHQGLPRAARPPHPAERNPVYGRDDPGSGPQTSYAYDAMGRRTLTTSPDTSADPAGARTGYGYDAAGNLTAITRRTR